MLRKFPSKPMVLPLFILLYSRIGLGDRLYVIRITITRRNSLVLDRRAGESGGTRVIARLLISHYCAVTLAGSLKVIPSGIL